MPRRNRNQTARRQEIAADECRISDEEPHLRLRGREVHGVFLNDHGAIDPDVFAAIDPDAIHRGLNNAPRTYTYRTVGNITGRASFPPSYFGDDGGTTTSDL